MKKLGLLFVSFLLFQSILLAQDPIIITGKIVDAKTNMPLEKVNIFNQTSDLGNTSELDGTFQIAIEGFPTIIIFSYIGYENLMLKVEEAPTESFVIPLQPSTFGLPEIEVTDQPKIEELTKKNYTVKDFILEKDKILILSSSGAFSKNKLILKNWDGKIIDELKLKKVHKLHRSCLGNIHIVGKKHGYEISLQQNKIQLISKYNIDKFTKLIEPCALATDDFLYWTSYELRDQLLAYTIISKIKRDIIKEIVVVDDKNLFRSQDDFVLAEQLGIAVSWIEKQSWNQLMYKPIFSPIHFYHNEICLFNHVKGYLEFFSQKGTNLRYLPITYHQNKNWERQILFDKKNNKAYTVYNTKTGKAIYEIDLEEGSTNPITFFDAEIIERMEIYDGNLFYLESGILSKDRNRILHRLKL